MATTDVMQPQVSATIPVPANFRVAWEQPDDAELFWTFNRMHCPECITPMAGEFVRMFGDGLNFTMETWEMPSRLRSRRINGYQYMAAFNTAMPPEAMQAASARSQELLGPMMAELDVLWDRDWMPEIKRYLADWETFDLPGASLAALLTHWDSMVSQLKRVWEIHGQLSLLAVGAQIGFADLYRHLFTGEDSLSALRLLQGFPNKTVESGEALWHLSRQALASSDVYAIIERTPPDAMARALDQIPAGQSFLRALQVYLEAYGRRSNRYFEVADPGWIEDPTPVFENLKDYVQQPPREPEGGRAALVAERERLLSDTRARLAAHPPEMVGQFEFLLKAAQTATVLQEDHGFWLDFRTIYEARRVLLEWGRRFATAGVLDKPEDVFYLTFAELHATVDAELRRDLRRLVGGRRAEMAYFRTITPPPALGTPPPPIPMDDPVAHMAAMFFGAPPAIQVEPDIVRGSAGSSGKVRGRAQIVRTLADAGKLQQGDILVTPTTSPPWTPLFATVAAVVTDTGGVLSHCAIVAREYGIPAVVGTGNATTAIQDGQLVEVDGSAGLVRIIAS